MGVHAPAGGENVELRGHRCQQIWPITDGRAPYDLLHSRSSSIVDVTIGNNTYGPLTNSDGNTYTVIGYNAGPDYDLASGLGTIEAARLVSALAGH